MSHANPTIEGVRLTQEETEKLLHILKSKELEKLTGFIPKKPKED